MSIYNLPRTIKIDNGSEFCVARCITVRATSTTQTASSAAPHTRRALSHRRKVAVVRFRLVQCLQFGGDAPHPAADELRIGLDGPRDFTLRLTGIAAGSPSHLAPPILDAPPDAPELPAYSRVLTPVLRAWANDEVPLQECPAGSDDPPLGNADHQADAE